jgi:peptidoglycan pentaglycine glycine transferase (the first glycine)
MHKLKVAAVRKKSDWENFILSHEEANFLQSWNWGVFHQNLGKNVFRFGLFKKPKLVGCVLAIKEEAKRGSHLTIAGGPILDWNNENHFRSFFSLIVETGKNEGCQFIRVRPQVLDTPQIRELFSAHGFKEAPMHLTADLTLQIDLAPTEEELLYKMRKSSRYEIRRAGKLKIEVKKSSNPQDIREFHKHQLALAKKHHFVPFSYEFLHLQFKTFAADNQALLFHAYKDKRLLASAFVIFYNKEAVYHYGISTKDNAHLPGSYACQWAAICEAKRRGIKRYNLWGVAPEDATHHRFAGVSRFKRGFGGKEVAHLPTHDLPLSWKYVFTYIFELGRKKFRKL